MCKKHLLGLIDEHRFEYTSGVVQIFLQCFRRDFTALQLTQKTTKSAAGHTRGERIITYYKSSYSAPVYRLDRKTHLSAALSQASGVSTAGKLSVVKSMSMSLAAVAGA